MFNVVPSISAVTGISPGRYLWRVVIAFHLGPRLLIVSTYYHFLLTFLETAAKRQGRTNEDDFSYPLSPLFLGTMFSYEFKKILMMLSLYYYHDLRIMNLEVM